jgi:hypothetical protein
MCVAQLEQILNADSTAPEPDADIARKTRTIGLTERLTDATLRAIEQAPRDRFSSSAGFGLVGGPLVLS